MSFQTEMRHSLEQRAQELRTRLGKIRSDRRREQGPLSADWEEQAVDLENEEVLTGLDDAARTELVRIQSAIDRLDAGSYGECIECGDDITENRLRAVPLRDPLPRLRRDHRRQLNPPFFLRGENPGPSADHFLLRGENPGPSVVVFGATGAPLPAPDTDTDRHPRRSRRVCGGPPRIAPARRRRRLECARRTRVGCP